MEKKEIEDYISKLQKLEKELTDDDDDSEDIEYLSELDGLLANLHSDILNGYNKSNSEMVVKVKKMVPEATIPSYSKDGDAGMDLTAVSVEHTPDYISYKTGLSFEIPTGYVGLLFPRSSNSKKDLLLTNSVGVLDSGYRGEVEFRFKPILGGVSIYGVGDRVGQIMILPYPKIKMVESTELSNSERGSGGFGSTGL
jgi:dUTP pyrophosphatase